MLMLFLGGDEEGRGKEGLEKRLSLTEPIIVCWDEAPAWISHAVVSSRRRAADADASNGRQRYRLMYMRDTLTTCQALLPPLLRSRARKVWSGRSGVLACWSGSLRARGFCLFPSLARTHFLQCM